MLELSKHVFPTLHSDDVALEWSALSESPHHGEACRGGKCCRKDKKDTHHYIFIPLLRQVPQRDTAQMSHLFLFCSKSAQHPLLEERKLVFYCREYRYGAENQYATEQARVIPKKCFLGFIVKGRLFFEKIVVIQKGLIFKNWRKHLFYRQ